MDSITGGGLRGRLSRAIETGPAGLGLRLAAGLRSRGRRRLESAHAFGERGAVAIEYIVVGVVVGVGVIAGATAIVNALGGRATAIQTAITALT